MTRYGKINILGMLLLPSPRPVRRHRVRYPHRHARYRLSLNLVPIVIGGLVSGCCYGGPIAPKGGQGSPLATLTGRARAGLVPVPCRRAGGSRSGARYIAARSTCEGVVLLSVVCWLGLLVARRR